MERVVGGKNKVQMADESDARGIREKNLKRKIGNGDVRVFMILLCENVMSI